MGLDDEIAVTMQSAAHSRLQALWVSTILPVTPINSSCIEGGNGVEHEHVAQPEPDILAVDDSKTAPSPPGAIHMSIAENDDVQLECSWDSYRQQKRDSVGWIQDMFHIFEHKDWQQTSMDEPDGVDAF